MRHSSKQLNDLAALTSTQSYSIGNLQSQSLSFTSILQIRFQSSKAYRFIFFLPLIIRVCGQVFYYTNLDQIFRRGFLIVSFRISNSRSKVCTPKESKC